MADLNEVVRIKKALVVLGMGGHTAQIIKLIDLLGTVYEYHYVIGHDDVTSKFKIKLRGTTYIVRNPRGISDNSFIKIFLNFLLSTINVIHLYLKVKPDFVISSGPAIAVPFFWVAKVFKIRSIFIESWSRIHTKSKTGILVYPVADLFFVQWKYMTTLYPRSIYAGRIT